MTPIIENAVLDTDLDARNFALNNVGALLPMPPNLAPGNDPRLTDPRMPLNGSVTDASVSATAGIAQSKLNLSGPVPPAWLGKTSTTAAQGNLAEYFANKGMPNGYAPLDGSGKVPVASLPSAVGLGTVTSVGLAMPAQFIVTGSPINGAGSISVAWASVPNLSWFGNNSGGTAAPQFYTTPLPVSLIPPLDASQVVSGTFAPALLPGAAYGTTHNAGAAPDPGTTSTGNPTDYLARNMTYMAVPTLSPPYQPTLPTPTLAFSGSGTSRQVIVSNTVAGVTFFYSTTSPGVAPFTEVPAGNYFALPSGQTWVYAARPGYANSALATIGP